MNSDRIPIPIAGSLLVATPDLNDPNFSHAVILLLAVQAEGALGIVLNRPSDHRVADVLSQWADDAAPPAVMFFGGPVGIDAVVGLCAHGTIDLNEPATDAVPPGGYRLFAGSAGWGYEQLQEEIAEGAWWVFDAHPDDVTTADPATLWQRVLRRQRGRTAWFALATADPSLN